MWYYVMCLRMNGCGREHIAKPKREIRFISTTGFVTGLWAVIGRTGDCTWLLHFFFFSSPCDSVRFLGRCDYVNAETMAGGAAETAWFVCILAVPIMGNGRLGDWFLDIKSLFVHQNWRLGMERLAGN